MGVEWLTDAMFGSSARRISMGIIISMILLVIGTLLFIEYERLDPSEKFLKQFMRTLAFAFGGSAGGIMISALSGVLVPLGVRKEIRRLRASRL
jgi:ACR3 family arsenite efflux pump ArsB